MDIYGELIMLDEADNEFVYWPLNLIEGEDSDPVIVKKTGPFTGKLFSTEDVRFAVFARINDSGDPFQDIGTTPLELDFTDPELELEVFGRANAPIEGLERVPISVVAGSSLPSGWLV